MPPAVRLIAWNFKEPIAIEYHAVLTDSAKFASATLIDSDLREAVNQLRNSPAVLPAWDSSGARAAPVAVESSDKLSEARR